MRQKCRVRHWGVLPRLAYTLTRQNFCFFTFINFLFLSFLSLSFISSTTSSVSLPPFSGRRHKMTHKGWLVVKPQRNQLTAKMRFSPVSGFRLYATSKRNNFNYFLKLWIKTYCNLSWCIPVSEAIDCSAFPCLNGGTCHNIHGSYRCRCPREFTGTNCELGIMRHNIRKRTFWHVRQRRLKSTCTPTHSDQNLLCRIGNTLHTWISIMYPVRILITLRECAFM